MMAAKRKQYSLDFKLEVLKAVENGEKKAGVAQKFGVSRSTLSTFLKDKPRIEKEAKSDCGGLAKKKIRHAQFQDLEEALFQWFNSLRSSNLPVSGPIICEKALQYAKELGHDSFVASSGWLWRFCNRFGIAAKHVCREESPVPVETVRKWREEKMKQVLKSYKPEDIFNADETGIFYELLPYQTLAVKGDRCRGGKKSKQRLTALLCCNASGTEKLKPFIIGRSKQPRCFKNVKSLPCTYAGNEKAWMTSSLFVDWVTKLNNDMAKKKRKIILLIDNCSAHNKLPHFSNVEVEYFPPNCTAVLQPLDGGIIRSLKGQYRKRLLKLALLNFEQNKVTKINVKQAIEMIVGAWNSVKQSTIVECFKRTIKVYTGTCSVTLPDTKDNDDEDLHPGEIWEKLQRVQAIPEDVDFNSYVTADDNLLVAHELTDADILENLPQHQDLNPDDSLSEDENEEPATVVSTAQALSAISTLKSYYQSKENVADSILSKIDDIETHIATTACKSLIQKSILSYLGNK